MYIYLGIYYHSRHKGTLCVVDDTGEYITLEKKIGKTIDLSSREASLNRTKSPIGYTMIRAWETGDKTDQIEFAIHDLLDNVRSEGEWFNDDDDTLTDRLASFMSRMGYPEVHLNDSTEDLVAKIVGTPAISASQIEEHRRLKSTYPELFTHGGKNFVSNNSHSLNVYMTNRPSGFVVSIASPDYKKYPCTTDEDFMAKFTEFTDTFDTVPHFNAKSAYITRISTEQEAVKIFMAAIEQVKDSKITIAKT